VNIAYGDKIPIKEFNYGSLVTPSSS